MCVTFTSNASATSTTVDAPCLCAQFAESFTAFFRGEDTSEAARADLAAHARPGCPFCHGTGVEPDERSDAPMVEWANDNATALFGVFGLAWDPVGEMTLAEARRCLMRARSRSSLDAFTRDELVEYGAPRPLDDGTVELRPLRAFGGGLDVDGIRERVARFETFVADCAERGATTIFWS